MATLPVRPRPTLGTGHRLDAQLALIDLWHRVKTVSSCIQHVDEGAVPYDRWAAAYELGESILQGGILRAEEWPSSPFPAEAHFIDVTRQVVRDDFRHALRAFRNLDWAPAHGYVFEVGRNLYTAATVLGVEL